MPEQQDSIATPEQRFRPRTIGVVLIVVSAIISAIAYRYDSTVSDSTLTDLGRYALLALWILCPALIGLGISISINDNYRTKWNLIAAVAAPVLVIFLVAWLTYQRCQQGQCF